MHRPRLVPPFALALGAIVAASCSLAVESNLDSKPPSTPPAGTNQADAQPDSTTQDSPYDAALNDVTDEAADAVEGLAEADTDADADASVEPDADGATDADGADDAETGPCAACPSSCCAGACVDLQGDARHCGSCANACLAGRSCSAGACKRGWVVTSNAPANTGRSRACAVWAGDRVFVWGGTNPSGSPVLGDGLLYYPKTDIWTTPSKVNAPSPRAEPLCLWTGAKVFVWGGLDGANLPLADGALWTPATDTWEALPATTVVGRSRPVAVWTGADAILWGGVDPSNAHSVRTGSVWQPGGAGSWTEVNTQNSPQRNKELAAAWSGSELLLFGGRDDVGDHVVATLVAYRPPATNAWTDPATTGTPPSERSAAFAAFAISHMFVWGGLDAVHATMADGGRLSVSASSAWEPMSTTGAPSPRAQVPFESGWVFADQGKIRLFGGTLTASIATDGATYDMASDTWSPIPSWATGAHHYGIGVWTGSEFMVWGGTDGTTALLKGSRWTP